MPIFRNDGSFFGTLCAIDPRPHRLKNPETIGMFKLFAELIAFHLDASERLAWSEASLLGERKTSELREQFIAVLGHDLRNPLASIDAGTRLLQKTPLNEKALTILEMMQASVVRMSGLINNVMDFARGRLGGGLNLDRRNEALGPVLDQVVAEFRMSQPDRAIETEFSLAEPVNCDRSRIAQLASNLIGNALLYGRAGAPVRVQAAIRDRAFMLSVSNSGEPISPVALKRLFLPFSRGDVLPNQQGLGLGLYIASEIARAHGGAIEVTSTAEETRFTFRMPAS
jgi:signal transduction histidine kinase